MLMILGFEWVLRVVFIIISYMSGEELQEISFPSEDLEKIIFQTLQAYLAPKNYEEREVPRWINEINEIVMEKLVSHQKPFKYLLNCLIMQRKGASVVISQSNIWDTGLDSCFTVAWPKETPNKAEKSKNSIQCMLSIYAMTMLNSNSLIKSEL